MSKIAQDIKTLLIKDLKVFANNLDKKWSPPSKLIDSHLLALIYIQDLQSIARIRGLKLATTVWLTYLQTQQSY